MINKFAALTCLNNVKTIPVINRKHVDKSNEALTFRASLEYNDWIAKRGGKKYPILLEEDVCNHFRIIYSSMLNDFYPMGTPKPHTINKKDYSPSSYWTPLRSGLMFKGFIVNDKVQLDYKSHEKITEKDYEEHCNKRTKE